MRILFVPSFVRDDEWYSRMEMEYTRGQDTTGFGTIVLFLKDNYTNHEHNIIHERMNVVLFASIIAEKWSYSNVKTNCQDDSLCFDPVIVQ